MDLGSAQVAEVSVLRHGSAAGSITTGLTQGLAQPEALKVAVESGDGKRRALSIEPPPGCMSKKNGFFSKNNFLFRGLVLGSRVVFIVFH